MPLDPRCKLTAPKYNHLEHGHLRAVGMGGSSLPYIQIDYPEVIKYLENPVPIWDPEKSLMSLKIVSVYLDLAIELSLIHVAMKNLR